MNRNEIEDLKVELNRVREQNQGLFQTIVEPGLHSKVQEFLDSFEDYFRERGFVIRKKDDKVRVSFDDLHLKAYADGGRDIFIMRGKEQIASVSVKFIGEGKRGIQGQLHESPVELEKELQKENSLTNDLKSPVFYYTGREFGYKYETPISVLDSIFGI